MGQEKIVELLLNANADINIKDNNGRNALILGILFKYWR